MRIYLRKNNYGVGSALSVIIILLVFSSTTATVTLLGIPTLNNARINSEAELVSNYYSKLNLLISNVMDDNSGSIISGNIIINEGNVRIDPVGNNFYVMYSYDPNFDFNFSGLEDRDDKFKIDMSKGNIDNATVYWLQDTCFLSGTKVLMADGSYKKIEEIKSDDFVKSYDFESKVFVGSRVKSVLRHKAEEMGEYYLSLNNDLCVTPNHLFYSNNIWIYADDLKVGDILFSYQDTAEYVIYSIEKIFEKEPSFDLEIKDSHNYFVSIDNVDVLVHNYETEEFEILLDEDNPGTNDAFEATDACTGGYPNSVGGPWSADSTLEQECSSSDYYWGSFLDEWEAGFWTYVHVHGTRAEGAVQQNYHFTVSPYYIDLHQNEILMLSLYWRGYFAKTHSGVNIIKKFDIIKNNSYEDIGVGEVPVYTHPYLQDCKDLFFNITDNFEDYIDDDNKLYIRSYFAEKTNYPDCRPTINADKVSLKIVNALPTCTLSAVQTNVGSYIFNYSMNAFDPTGEIAEWELDVDNNGIVDYSGNGYPPDQISHTFSGMIPTHAKLTVRDTLGGEGFIVSPLVLIFPPACNIIAEPDSGESPLDVTLTINAYDIDGQITYWGVDIDNDGTIEYQQTGEFGNSFEHILSHTYITGFETTEYTAKIIVRDNDNIYSYNNCTIFVWPEFIPNFPPDTPDVPIFLGQVKNLYNSTIYDFNVITNDPDDDNIRYCIDWDDGTDLEWTGFIISGEELLVNHEWKTVGVHEIRVKAQDINGKESSWSDPLAVKINHKYVIPPDREERKTQRIKNIDQKNPWENITTNFDLNGSVCIHLFSDNYPSSIDPAKGTIPFGVIYKFKLGRIIHSLFSSEGTINSIYENGGVVKDKFGSKHIKTYSNLFESLDTIGFKIVMLRSENNMSFQGEDNYQIQFENINRINREQAGHDIYNIKIKFDGDTKIAWVNYILSHDYTKFEKQLGPYNDFFIYENGIKKQLIITTALINCNISNLY